MTVSLEVPPFMPSVEEMQARERLLKATYFLVRQGSMGEKMRCSRCGAKHTYLTLMCIDRPFSGVTEGLFGYWHSAGVTGAANHLTPAEREKYDTLTRRFGTDLAISHPQTAASFKLADTDVELGAVALGTLEPITRQQAQSLVWRINARGLRPPLLVEGIRGGL